MLDPVAGFLSAIVEVRADPDKMLEGAFFSATVVAGRADAVVKRREPYLVVASAASGNIEKNKVLWCQSLCGGFSSLNIKFK